MHHEKTACQLMQLFQHVKNWRMTFKFMAQGLKVMSFGFQFF